MSQSPENEQKRSVAERFWDMYEAKGIGMAMLLLADEFDFNEKGVRDELPNIMGEAKTRGISMQQFLKEFEDATGVNNNGGRVPSDVDSEDSQHQDEDGASQTRDADGEDQDGDDETEGSEGVQ